jgi:hypothetical protein
MPPRLQQQSSQECHSDFVARSTIPPEPHQYRALPAISMAMEKQTWQSQNQAEYPY